MNPIFPFSQIEPSTVSYSPEQLHVYVLAFADIKGIGVSRLNLCKSRLLTLRNDREAYQFFQEIRNKRPRVIPELEFKDFSHKIEVAKRELEAKEKLGAHLVSFESSLYQKLFANTQNPPLYFFYWGDKEALLNKGIAFVAGSDVNEFSKKKVTKMADYISERGWNSIFSFDANSLIDQEFISRSTQSFRAGTTCLLVQKAPLAETLKDGLLTSAITGNHGCLIGISLVGGEEKQPTWYNSLQLQTALSKGTFAFGYTADGTPTSQMHQKAYYDSIRRSGKQIICYKCDPKQILDPNYADLACSEGLLQDAKLLQEGRISSLYWPRDIDAFLDRCLKW